MLLDKEPVPGRLTSLLREWPTLVHPSSHYSQRFSHFTATAFNRLSRLHLPKWWPRSIFQACTASATSALCGTQFATSLPFEYPISSSKINASQFSEQAQESFQISKTLVYLSFVDGARTQTKTSPTLVVQSSVSKRCLVSISWSLSWSTSMTRASVLTALLYASLSEL